MEKARLDEREWNPQPSQDPGGEVLKGAEMATPATKHTTEDQGRGERSQREDGARGQEPVAEEIVEKRLEVQAADVRPVDGVVRHDVADQHQMEKNLERDA